MSISPDNRPERLAYFDRDGDLFLPRPNTRSPWHEHAMNGVTVAGLLMHAVDGMPDGEGMLPAHLNIDILRPTPRQPCRLETQVLRGGKRMQLIEARLVVDGETYAIARLARLREAASPAVRPPLAYPPPEALPPNHMMDQQAPMRDMLETRLIFGRDDSGKGAMWGRFTSDLIPGVPIEGVLQAAMFADFPNGLSRAADREKWSFANIDISLSLVRRPIGEWMLLDAVTEVQGLGVGLASAVMCDRHGPFGRAAQTLVIAPRG